MSYHIISLSLINWTIGIPSGALWANDQFWKQELDGEIIEHLKEIMKLKEENLLSFIFKYFSGFTFKISSTRVSFKEMPRCQLGDNT